MSILLKNGSKNCEKANKSIFRSFFQYFLPIHRNQLIHFAACQRKFPIANVVFVDLSGSEFLGKIINLNFFSKFSGEKKTKKNRNFKKIRENNFFLWFFNLKKNFFLQFYFKK